MSERVYLRGYAVGGMMPTLMQGPIPLPEDVTCPVCGYRANLAQDERGVRFDHPGRYWPCRMVDDQRLRALREASAANWPRIARGAA